MVLLAIIAIILFQSFFVEPNTLEATKYEIANEQLAGVRVVFLSDFHLKKRDYKRINKVVELANKQKPDIVLVGGDFARSKNPKMNMNTGLIASKLQNIGAPVYAVLGETDNWADRNGITNDLTLNGVKVLDNSNRRIIVKRRYVDIIGIADLTTRQPNIGAAFSRTKIPRIAITHNPDIYYDIIDDVSLILAGHTHGGQFIIPFTPALFVPSKFGSEFASGLIASSNNKMIISRGIGTTGVPLRFNCKPEIVVVDFVK